jgi:hypothetical protein
VDHADRVDRSPLDSLLRPSSAAARPVPLSERLPEVEVRPVPRPLRLAPDPTTTVWCADLLAGPGRSAPAPARAVSTTAASPTVATATSAVNPSVMHPATSGPPLSATSGGAFTLFG